LRLQTNNESVETLKAQVATLGSKVEKSDEEAVQLKANIAQLQKDLGAMKLMNMRRQKAEAAAKKPAVDKKKPVKPTRRST
jgi:peptidoglycan hydrolase CwlO-like protein